ncbi:MAG: 50S ribosomal protein L28 [Dehalococcoidia bacterium]|nr:50S ribosomal protein L28 [Dehalococcoidia bacterium]
MMAKCTICGKVGHSGNNVSHSKRRTKTRFLPNIQKAKLDIGGIYKKIAICTRCLRTTQKTPKNTVI